MACHFIIWRLSCSISNSVHHYKGKIKKKKPWYSGIAVKGFLLTYGLSCKWPSCQLYSSIKLQLQYERKEKRISVGPMHSVIQTIYIYLIKFIVKNVPKWCRNYEILLMSPVKMKLKKLINNSFWEVFNLLLKILIFPCLSYNFALNSYFIKH